MTDKTIAEAYRGALQDGFIKEKNVIDWVDSIIQNRAKPEYIFIELSTAKGKDLIALLGHVKGTLSPDEVIRLRLGFISRALAINPQMTRDIPYLFKHIAEQSAENDELPIPDEIRTQMYDLFTEWDWGECTMDVMHRKLREFFQKYAMQIDTQ